MNHFVSISNQFSVTSMIIDHKYSLCFDKNEAFGILFKFFPNTLRNFCQLLL